MHRPVFAFDRKIQGRLAVSAAVAAMFAATAHTYAAPKYFDTSDGNGLGGGSAVWDTGITATWNSASNGNVTPRVTWTDWDDATFQTGTANTVTVTGTVRANSIANTGGGTHTTVDGTGVLELGAGGLITSLSNGATFGSDLSIVFTTDQLWQISSPTTVHSGISGVGRSLTKTGGAALTLTANNAYSGATTVESGQLVLSGQGSISASSGLTIRTGDPFIGAAFASPYVHLNNAGANSNDRIAGDVTIGLHGRLRLEGNAEESPVSTTENIGKLIFDGGQGTLEILQRNPAITATLAATSLERASSGTGILILHNASNATNQSKLSLGTVPSGVNLVGAGGTAAGFGGVKNLGIVPWLVAGNNVDLATNVHLATYDTTGATLRRLADNEYDAITATYNTIGNNVTVDASTTLTGDARDLTINALRFNGAYTFNGRSGDTLTISSGALTQANNAATLGGFGKVTFGNGEGVIHTVNTLTIASPIDVSGNGGLTKGGTTGSTLILTANNLYTGTTTVNAGTLQIGNGGNAGSVGASGAVVLNGGNVVVNRAGTLSLNVTGTRTVRDAAQGSLTKTGSGALTLTGDNFVPGSLLVTGGSLLIGPGASLNVGHQYAVNSAAIYQAGGDVLLEASGSPRLAVAGSAGSHGFYQLSDGSITAVNNRVRIGNGANANGIFYQTGGTFSISGTDGNLDMNAGLATDTGANSVYYQTGGLVTSNALTLGYTISNSQVTITNARQVHNEVKLGDSAGQVAVLNLNVGSVLETARIWTNAGGSTDTAVRHVNFNGGTVKTPGGTNANNAFIGSNAYYSVIIREGGATIEVTDPDPTKFARVEQPLIAPSGSGVIGSDGSYTIPIADGGSGYVGAPFVVISGATGATAVANMKPDGNGTYYVESITITSPGVGVTGTPTFSFVGGGFTTPAQPVPLAVKPNVSGGLTKKGPGELRLQAANTFSGETRIEEGLLSLHTNGSIDQSSAVNVLEGARFSTAAKTNGYAVNGLKGGGSVVGLSGKALSINGGALLAPGDDGVGDLEITAGDLVIGDGVSYHYEIASDGSDLVNIRAGELSFVDTWTLKLFSIDNVDPAGQEFVLFDYSSTTHPTWSLVTIDLSATNWQGGVVWVDEANGRVILSGLEVVPEPSAVALLGLMAVPMLRRRRV